MHPTLQNLHEKVIKANIISIQSVKINNTLIEKLRTEEGLPNFKINKITK